jgi:hypothetical protein
MNLPVVLRRVESQKTVSPYPNVRLLFGPDMQICRTVSCAPVYPRHATQPRLQCVGCNGACNKPITDVRMWFVL